MAASDALPALLSPETVGAYLVARGLVAPGDDVRAETLGGGISNVVLAVRVRGRPDGLVVKQALPRLRVADDWPAKRERAVTEARALALAGRLTPGAVPPVLDCDERACALAIALAPAGWRPWKELLLAGEADAGVARRLGEVLAAWHAATWDDADAAARFDELEAFEQLRVDPYHRTVMRRLPELAGAVAPYVERLLGERRCLVHGDYSPKNVLVAADGLWVLDFEVAHFGNPVFDLAFLLNHLLLKAVARPDAAAGYRACAQAFWEAYRAGVPPPARPDLRETLGQTGCLTVARVDGKSPVEYLAAAGQATARRLGVRLVREPPASLAGAFDLVAQGASA